MCRWLRAGGTRQSPCPDGFTPRRCCATPRDKPDLRFGCEIADVSDVLAETEFKAFRGVIEAGGVVRGFAAPGAMEFSRKDFDGLVGFAQEWGGKGVAWLQVTGEEIRSPIAKFLSADELAGIVQRIGAQPGETIFLVADSEEQAVRALGPLRLHLGERLGLYPRRLALPVGDRLPGLRVAGRRGPLEGGAPSLHIAQPRDVAQLPRGSGGRAGARLRPRPERQRGRWAPSGSTIKRCSGACSRRLGSRPRRRGEVLVPAAGALDGGTPARRDRVRARPADDAAGLSRLAARGDRLPQGHGRGRSADRRSQRRARAGPGRGRDPSGRAAQPGLSLTG